MLEVPITVLILSAAITLILAKLAARFRVPAVSSTIVIPCLIAFGLELAPATWKPWLAGGLPGDRAMVIARYAGIAALVFVAGSRLNLDETWNTRRRVTLIASTGALVVLPASMLLGTVFGFNRQELAVFIAASVGASLWPPCGESPRRNALGAVSGGAAASLAALALLFTHLFAALDPLIARQVSWAANLAAGAYELGKVVMFFATAWFVSSAYIRLARPVRQSPRMLVGFLLIAGLAFALGFRLIGPLAALAWCYAAGFLFAGIDPGAKLARAEPAVVSSLLLSLTFIPIALQSHGRTALLPGAIAAVALAATAVRFGAVWLGARLSGLRGRDCSSIAARLLSPGEIGVLVLWFGMTTWFVGGDGYYAILTLTLLSMAAAQVAQRFAGSPAGSEGALAKSPEQARLAPSPGRTGDAEGHEKLAANRRQQIRGSRRRGKHSVSLAAVALLALVTAYNVEAQGRSGTDDPAARAMDSMAKSVEPAAASAGAILQARGLVQRSDEQRRAGQHQDAAETLGKAISLLDAASQSQADPLINYYRTKLVEHQPPLNSEGGLVSAAFPVALSPSGSISRAVLLRFNGYKETLAPILKEENVPPQLLAVALVESGFNQFALSPRGALGIWQFMPATARRYGLLALRGDDRRTDPEESTRAAARYLRDLYSRFGDWKLALAAYNAGEEKVQKAIDWSRSRDFDEIARRGYLPLETRKYVPAVLAAWARMSPHGVGAIQPAGPTPARAKPSGRVFIPPGSPRADSKGEVK